MKDFTNFDTIQPRLMPIPPQFREYKLLDSISYNVGEALSGDRIIVPRGFITDCASIPRVFWSVLPPFGRYAPASWVHDYLYVSQERSRSEADYIFREAMKVLGVPWYKRNAMYCAVRIGGYIPWLKRKKQLKAG